MTPPARFQLLDTSSNTSSPPALLQACPNSTPNPFIPQEISFYFIFFFLQPNKAGFYLGSVTLSAILGITWRPHTPQQQQKNSFWRSHNKNRRQKADTSQLQPLKNKKTPKNVTQLRCFNNLREEFRPGASRVTQLMKFFLGNEEQLGDYIRNAPQTRCYNRKERGFT